MYYFLCTTIFLLSLSSLSFEVMLTRFFLVSQWSPLSFMVISIALLGYAASGRFSYRAEFLLTSSRTFILKVLLLIYCTVCIFSYLFLNIVPMDYFRIMIEKKQLLYLFFTYLVLSVPFFITGIVISVSYSFLPDRAGNIYLLNMVGSAIGVILPFLLLGKIGEGDMLILAGLLPLLGIFTGTGFSERSDVPAFLLAVFIVTGALLFYFFNYEDLSFFRVSPYKALSQIMKYPNTRIVKSVVNIEERVDLVESPYVRFAPGLSLTYHKPVFGKRAVLLNGDTVFSLPVDDRGFYYYLLSFAGYNLLEERGVSDSRVLVAEEGGGIGVPCALAGGAGEVDVLVNSKGVYDVYREAVRGIRLIRDNPRAYLAMRGFSLKASSAVGLYDLIQIENWGSSIPGMASTSIQSLFTVEALASCLNLLSENGLIVISRKLLLPPSDSIRLFLTAIEAIHSKNGYSRQPYKNIVVMRNWDTYTMLVSKKPFSARDLSVLKRFATRMNFDFIYYPGMQRNEANRYNIYEKPFFYSKFNELVEIINTGTYHSFLTNYYLDIKPLHDNRPFQNRFIRLSGIARYFIVTGKRPYKLLMSGEVVIVVVLFEAMLLSLIILFIPLRATVLRTDFFTWIYFFSVGSGFMFVEMALIKMFITVIGNPVVSFSLVLSVVLILSGLGGNLTNRVHGNLSKPRKFTSIPILLLSAILMVFFLEYSRLFHAILCLASPLRYVMCVLIIIPISLLMGFPFPTGIRYIASSNRERSYAWSVNGVSSVLVAIISEYISQSVGIDMLILAGSISYFLIFVSWYFIWTNQKGVSIL